MKLTAYAVLVATIIPFSLFAKDIDVVFIGLSEGGAPAFEESLDRRVRENISTLPGLAILDYLQTQSFRRKVHFDDFPTVSRKLIESLRQYTTDSTVFVWGRIKSSTLSGKRKSLIKGFIQGNLALTLNVYSLRYKNFPFCGDVQTSYEKSKGLIFFGDAEKDIIVSTPERSEMTDHLVEQAARKSASLIATIIQSEQLHAAKEADVAGAKAYEVPSVSDMFNMPSVEAATIGKNRKIPPVAPAPVMAPAPAPVLAPKPLAPAPAAPVPIKADSAKTPPKTAPPIDTVKGNGKTK
jgi:hypothetical protein